MIVQSCSAATSSMICSTRSRTGIGHALESVTHWSYHHLPAPLGTPDDVVHHQVDVGLLVLILHVSTILLFNSACTSEEPFIPRLTPRAFWPMSCKLATGAPICAPHVPLQLHLKFRAEYVMNEFAQR